MGTVFLFTVKPSIFCNKEIIIYNIGVFSYLSFFMNDTFYKFKPDDRGEYKGEVWGSIEDGYVIIMNNVFNRMCEKGNFSSKSFLSWANKLGLIKSDKGRNTKKKRLDGLLSWCVFLKIQDDSVDEDGFIRVSEDIQEELPFK